MQFFFFHSLVALRRSHFQCGKCEGRRSLSSEARTPSLALPPRWARKGVLHLWCVTRLTFVCMLRYSEWDAVPIWVPGFFGTYSGMVYWAGFRTLQYLQWNVILIWFPNSSIFIMSRYSNPSSGLFGICAETLRRYSCPFTIPGQDAPRPLPSPARVLSFFLPAGSVSQRERISVRAVAEEGWYPLPLASAFPSTSQSPSTPPTNPKQKKLQAMSQTAWSFHQSQFTFS